MVYNIFYYFTKKIADIPQTHPIERSPVLKNSYNRFLPNVSGVEFCQHVPEDFYYVSQLHFIATVYRSLRRPRINLSQFSALKAVCKII